MRLDADARAVWDDLGAVVLRGALDPEAVAEVDAWTRAVEGWADAGGPGLHHWEQTDAGPALARTEDVIPHHDGLRRLLTEGLLVEVAGELLGEPAVLYKEKVNYKQPGGGGFAPHQDAPAYRFVDHHVSCMVPLDPATEASGCLWVAPGHERGLLPMDGLRGLAEDVVAELDWRPVEVGPGDLLWFDSYVPHRSGTNTTDAPRRAWYLTYNAAAAGDQRATYYDDKRDELAGAEAGDRVRLSVTDDFLGRPVEVEGG